MRSIYFAFFGKELQIDVSCTGENLPRTSTGLLLPRSRNSARFRQNGDTTRIESELREKELRLETLGRLELEKESIVTRLIREAEGHQETILSLAKEEQESKTRVLQLSQEIAGLQEQFMAYMEAGRTKEQRGEIPATRPYENRSPNVTAQRNLDSRVEVGKESQGNQELQENILFLSPDHDQQPEEPDQLGEAIMTHHAPTEPHHQLIKASRKKRLFSIRHLTRLQTRGIRRRIRTDSKRPQEAHSKQGTTRGSTRRNVSPRHPSHRITQLNFERHPEGLTMEM